MMRLNMWLGAASLAAVLCIGTTNATAQDRQDRPGRGNFDPAQIRERMMGDLRERMEVKDDTEWKALEPMIQKVMDARMAAFRGNGMGRGGFRGGGGGGGGTGDNADRGNRRGGFFNQEPSPEAEALQRAIDAKASGSELKAALAKYTEARKAKQAELEKAQADLRKVLSLRQEAVATMSGLL
jgi:hypothetical protein